MSSHGLRRPPVLVHGAETIRGIGPATLLAILIGGIGVAYVAVEQQSSYRLALAVALAANLVVLSMKWPRAGALTTLFFLPFLALVRRLLLLDDVPWNPNDPLVVVGPVVTLFLVYRVYVLGERRLTTDLLSKLILGMVALCALEVVNPFARGTLLSNLGGLIFLAVPPLWFFIGRGVADRVSMGIVLRGLIVLGLVVGLYGVYQTELTPPGVLPKWDQEWYEVAGYSALNVGTDVTNNTVRAFSTFPSNGEYSSFLAIALVCTVALAFHRRPFYLLAAPFLIVAVFYSGGRATMALAGFAIVFLAGMRTRNVAWATAIVIVGVGAVFAFSAIAGPTLDQAAGATGNRVAQRNLQGFLNPLDPNGSGVARWFSFLDGIDDGIKNPAGAGTGAANRAGTNLSNDSQGTQVTDNDISSVFLSLGLVGGVLYLVIIGVMLRAVFRAYVRTRSWLVFATMGILIVMFGNWMNGAMYAAAPLVWFLVGWTTGPDVDTAARVKVKQRRKPGDMGLPASPPSEPPALTSPA